MSEALSKEWLAGKATDILFAKLRTFQPWETTLFSSNGL